MILTQIYFMQDMLKIEALTLNFKYFRCFLFNPLCHLTKLAICCVGEIENILKT